MSEWASERWIHDHEVRCPRGQHQLLKALGLLVCSRTAHDLPTSGEKGQHRVALDEVERSDSDSVAGFLALPAVGHRVDLRVAERHGRVRARQHRGGQVRRGGHDVRADQRVLHHRAMQRLVVAAAAAVARRDRAVGGGEQDAGPARKIGDAQRLHRLGVGPVHVQPRHRQLGEQGRRGGQRVERREELPVRDQPPEHLAGEILRTGRPDAVEFPGDPVQTIQHGLRRAVRNGQQHIRSDLEDRPVVDLAEDVAPGLQDLALQQPATGAAQFVERADLVCACDGGVDGERVGDDRHRHTRGLLAVLLVERLGDPREDVGVGVLKVGSQDRGGLSDAFLEDAHALGDAAF